jgi:Arc/MetJ family transcription regulator
MRVTRTNIDIDDELIAEVMRRHGLRTKREAVDLALRRLVADRSSRERLLTLRGVGWSGDLDEIRAAWAPRT